MTTWLDTAEAAIHLRKNPHEVRRDAAAGHIPAHKFGREWRFDLDELDAHVRGGLPPAPTPGRPILSRRSKRR